MIQSSKHLVEIQYVLKRHGLAGEKAEDVAEEAIRAGRYDVLLDLDALGHDILKAFLDNGQDATLNRLLITGAFGLKWFQRRHMLPVILRKSFALIVALCIKKRYYVDYDDLRYALDWDWSEKDTRHPRTQRQLVYQRLAFVGLIKRCLDLQVLGDNGQIDNFLFSVMNLCSKKAWDCVTLAGVPIPEETNETAASAIRLKYPNFFELLATHHMQKEE